MKPLATAEPFDMFSHASIPCLRLAALNEEIREADMTLHDDTFNDVVQVTTFSTAISDLN